MNDEIIRGLIPNENNGWLNPRNWHRSYQRKTAIQLDFIRKKLKIFTTSCHSQLVVPACWQQAGIIF